MSKAFTTILNAILAEDNFEDVSPILLANWSCTLFGERPLIDVLLKKYAGGGGGGSGTGDVNGPAGATTDNALTRWNGTSGESIQNSTWILADNGSMTAAQTGTGSIFTATQNGAGVAVKGVASASGGIALFGEATDAGASQLRLKNSDGLSADINFLGTEDASADLLGGGVLTVKTEAPTAITDPGFEGAWAEDGDYIYIFCAGLSEWRRTSLAAW